MKKNLIAAALIVCMGLADASLYFGYASQKNDISDDLRMITEEHELETAYADGHYDGNDSDSENGGSGSVEIAEGKKLFNILEILPTEKKGVIGYTIGGCEPFEVEEVKQGDKVIATKQQLKQAAMDALVNPNPGSENGNDQNIVNNYSPAKYLKELREKLNESSTTYPFDFEHSKTYDGYYKYVGNNKGFFSVENKGSNPTFKSRFYNSGSDFDYIFVYGETSSNPSDINVTGQKRIKYINNEKFIKDWLGKTGNDAVKLKNETEFEVTTRTPVSVSLQDIERADLILLNDAYKGDSYKFALEIQNDLLGKDKDLDNGLHFYSPENDGTLAKGNRLDFDDFEKVIRIYERVVVREDAAFVAEKTCCTTYNGGEIQSANTNLRKLMFMLFYVQVGTGENAKKQAGRDLFSDFFKRYTSQPGTEYLNLRKLHLEDPEHYPVDYRATSLKRNTSDPTRSDYYYMHVTTPGAHVGHPLVLDKSTAITGATLDSYYYGDRLIYVPRLDDYGNIVPLHDDSKIDSERTHIIERTDKDMFDDAGIDFQTGSSQEPGKYYKSGNNYYYKYAYDSMSNTTDYIYIDNDGSLVIDAKYSSDQDYNTNYKNYWFRIDQDDSIDGYDYRRRKWASERYDMDDSTNPRPWPWDSSGDGKELSVWLMHKQTNNYYDCNMHMWYDYFQFRGDNDKYYTSKQAPFGKTYRNQSLMEENGFFKGGWIKNALSGRTIKREETDINHIVNKTKKEYYLSMNILNGDGVNKKGVSADPKLKNKNKTLYYNQYEEERIIASENETGKAYIPISIRIKSSCDLKEIKLIGPKGSVTYPLNVKLEKQSEITSSGGKGLVLKRQAGSVGADGLPTEKTPTDFAPIHSFEGKIYDVMYNENWYKGRRNTKIKVELTVTLPDNKTEKTISDEITIVKRDFFMLD